VAREIFVGYDEWGKRVQVTPDQRSTHMQVVGSTGTGKSKFLEFMVRQDLMAGHGLCLIDPHGSFYEAILNWLCFKWVTHRDIFLFNPSAGRRVTFFNPFVRDPEGDLSVQVDRRIKATLRAWGMEDSDETPTLEKWLRCIFWVLLEKGLSINETLYFIDYNQEQVRSFLIAGTSNPAIKAQLDKLKSYKRKEFDDQLLSTQNRFFRLLTSRQIAGTMGMTDLNLDFTQIIESGKVLLVNLQPSIHLSGENSNLLGALLINQLYEIALKRKEGAEPFYLYVDECHRYISSDFARILEECRKRGLHMIFAHQTLGQVEEDRRVLKAVLGSAKMKAVFGDLPREDADTFVDEIFRLDLNETKKILYGTKFWPVYKRDKIYSQGKGEMSGDGSASGDSRGSVSGTSAQMYPTDSFQGMYSMSDAFGFQSSSSSFDAKSEFVGEADIPVIIPIPVSERIKEETWPLEEQRRRVSDVLKFQFQRHCFLKVPESDVQPHLVPFVPAYPIYGKIHEEYEDLLYQRFHEWLPAEQVPQKIEKRQEALLAEAQKFHTINVEPSEKEAAETRPKTKAKAPPKTQRIKPKQSKT